MARKMVNYFVHASCKRDEMQADIERILKEGWELYGNPWSEIIGFQDRYEIWVHQAIVRYSDAKDVNPKRHDLKEMATESVLFMPIERLNLSKRTINHLKTSGIFKIKNLVFLNEGDALNIPGVGPTTLKEIKDRLKELGLSFRSEK